MTDPTIDRPDVYGDPLTSSFWDGADHHELRMPACVACGHIAWYPTPFCLPCGGDLQWIRLSGRGTIHSQVVVRVAVQPDLVPPYVVGLVDLDEGPRFLAFIDGLVGATRIGDAVQVAWRDRPGSPPLPVFKLSPLPLPPRPEGSHDDD